jgi:capsular exopolysaccharide synthesis family protein
VAASGEVDGHLVSLVAPAGLEAEQYRALRHVVEQRRKTDNLSVIAVSSPGVGDGKTTTAINLAGALAQGADASVLLVEADLRQPAISRLLGFGDSARLGLVDAILDPKLTLADIVQPRPPYNLSVVVAGQTPPSPYEVLKSPRLGTLLEEARRQYDYVVMDTTPLVAVQDCRVVARWVDGVVVVVAADRTPRALLEAALDVLDPAKVVGLVFNGFDHLLSNRYHRYYSAYYAPSATAGTAPEHSGRSPKGLARSRVAVAAQPGAAPGAAFVEPGRARGSRSLPGGVRKHLRLGPSPVRGLDRRGHDDLAGRGHFLLLQHRVLLQRSL